MQTKYILGYKIDLNLLDSKPAIEFDEKGHSDKNIDYKIKWQKKQ